MPQFVKGYFSVLDKVKSEGKQVIFKTRQRVRSCLKHHKELMADASTYMDGSLYKPSLGCGSISSIMDRLSGMMLISSWSLDMLWSGIQLDTVFPDLRNHQHLDRHRTRIPPPSLSQNKTGTKACALFNQGKCGAQADHPSDHHICGYCLNVVKGVCVHLERFCSRKIYDQAAKTKWGMC